MYVESSWEIWVLISSLCERMLTLCTSNVKQAYSKDCEACYYRVRCIWLSDFCFVCRWSMVVFYGSKWINYVYYKWDCICFVTQNLNNELLSYYVTFTSIAVWEILLVTWASITYIIPLTWGCCHLKSWMPSLPPFQLSILTILQHERHWIVLPHSWVHS